MVSVHEKKGEMREFYCLSTDTKPTEDDYEIGNGDILLEIDTCNFYLYDASGQDWKEVN